MSFIQQDYVLRQIEMISEMITKALLLKNEHKVSEGLHLIDATVREILGPHADMINMVDAATAAHLIGDPLKIRAYADLLKTRGELLSDHKRQTRIQQRVSDLNQEALKLGN